MAPRALGKGFCSCPLLTGVQAGQKHKALHVAIREFAKLKWQYTCRRKTFNLSHKPLNYEIALVYIDVKSDTPTCLWLFSMCIPKLYKIMFDGYRLGLKYRRGMLDKGRRRNKDDL